MSKIETLTNIEHSIKALIEMSEGHMYPHRVKMLEVVLRSTQTQIRRAKRAEVLSMLPPTQARGRGRPPKAQ